MDSEGLGEPEGEWGWGVFLDLERWGGGSVFGGEEESRGKGKGGGVHTSPPWLPSREPRPGMSRANVQGTFWASVRIAWMS